MKKYLIFGKRATNGLWQDEKDLDPVIEAIDVLEAEIFIFDPVTTPIHEILEVHSKWKDYSYLTEEQYEQLVERV